MLTLKIQKLALKNIQNGEHETSVSIIGAGV